MPASLLRRTVIVAAFAALGLTVAGCRGRHEGAVRVIVLGGQPKLTDPAAGPLSPSDAVLLANVAQGLVRFDPNGEIEPGLAERWNVSDDGMSYLFRLANGNWLGGGKITAQQVARILRREIGASSNNPLKDALGAVDDIVAMTDRVIEIRLRAPRPNLLPLLAQPELAIVRGGAGTGPFQLVPSKSAGELRLERKVLDSDGEESQREDVLLSGADAQTGVREFAGGDADLVLGGSFADLPYARAVKLPRNSLRFDPASGLFGLAPVRGDGPLANPEVRKLLSQAVDRGALVDGLDVPGLSSRATVLEPGLDGVPDPIVPAWMGTAIADRRAGLVAASNRLFGTTQKPTIRVALPQGPGADALLNELVRDWGILGLKVERADRLAGADLKLVDAVAPSASPAWFLRQFRCEATPVCDSDTDKLLDAARASPVPAQRYALLAEAARRIDDAQLFLPLTAPVRWSLVSGRIQSFAGNRYARHTLTDLEQKLGGGSD